MLDLPLAATFAWGREEGRRREKKKKKKKANE